MFKNSVSITGSLKDLEKFEKKIQKAGYAPTVHGTGKNYIVTYTDGEYHYLGHKGGETDRLVFTLPQDFEKALEAIKERI